jgi:hypothetical protein
MSGYTAVDDFHDQVNYLVFKRIIKDGKNLIIELSSEENKEIEIRFDSNVAFFYRDEMDAYLTITEINPQKNNLRHVYKAEQSRLIEFFNTECGWINEKLIHWIILTSDSLIDVISYSPPKIIFK